jgi:hypothetical protein
VPLTLEGVPREITHLVDGVPHLQGMRGPAGFAVVDDAGHGTPIGAPGLSETISPAVTRAAYQ